jgi:hypothetical protein
VADRAEVVVSVEELVVPEPVLVAGEVSVPVAVPVQRAAAVPEEAVPEAEVETSC